MKAISTFKPRRLKSTLLALLVVTLTIETPIWNSTFKSATLRRLSKRLLTYARSEVQTDFVVFAACSRLWTEIVTAHSALLSLSMPCVIMAWPFQRSKWLKSSSISIQTKMASCLSMNFCALSADLSTHVVLIWSIKLTLFLTRMAVAKWPLMTLELHMMSASIRISRAVARLLTKCFLTSWLSGKPIRETESSQLKSSRTTTRIWAQALTTTTTSSSWLETRKWKTLRMPELNLF